jgi:molybdate transport system substrate-binding protein
MDAIRVTAAVLKFSKSPEQAKKFVAFIASDAGQKVWNQFGFSALAAVPATRPATNIPAAVNPESVGDKILLIHCCAGMRKAIDRLAREFGERRGAKIELNYAGSNRLLGQIQLVRRGDVFIAGDAEYIGQAIAAGLVTNGFTFCLYRPVIMVQKENPLGIKTLSDLLKPGVRIGQGDETAAAIGKQTVKILSLNKIDRQAWNRNVRLNALTVNELGAAVKLRTIDAALVWSSTAADYAADSATVTLDPAGTLISDVQGAVLTCARDAALAQEFLDFLLTPAAQATLVESGYVVRRMAPVAQ